MARSRRSATPSSAPRRVNRRRAVLGATYRRPRRLRASLGLVGLSSRRKAREKRTIPKKPLTLAALAAAIAQETRPRPAQANQVTRPVRPALPVRRVASRPVAASSRMSTSGSLPAPKQAVAQNVSPRTLPIWKPKAAPREQCVKRKETRRAVIIATGHGGRNGGTRKRQPEPC